MHAKSLAIYQKYYGDPRHDRRSLFRVLAAHTAISTALYPGSFVHIVPSFFFPTTVYVDTDKHARRFFADPDLIAFIQVRKEYAHDPTVRFHAVSYLHPLPEPDQGADVLISQFAGFVSQHCRRYLRIGGFLVANDSHGDASMAALDPSYTLLGACIEQDDVYRLQTSHLDHYFIPRRGEPATKEDLERTQRGIDYTHSADAYLFQRVA
ncbi:MAG: hypothetical protein HC822_03765 [Oscillochloris sp.]|nr:hypothetical protein [Oscillochloris sp.]